MTTDDRPKQLARDILPRQRAYAQVDVFTDVALNGNPLAVVLDGTDLDTQQMAEFARWTNLTETTFLLPATTPEADYRVRIFTPASELPFAGHPTLGSCHAWLKSGGRPRSADVVVQESARGLVRIRLDKRPAFMAPTPKIESVDPVLQERVCLALGLDPRVVRDCAWLDIGPRQLTLLLEDASSVLGLVPDFTALRSLANVGVIGPYPPGAACEFEVRFFAPSIGVNEDAVTGSLNASVAHWLIGTGRAPAAYVAAQGAALGRAGRVHVLRDERGTWIGGDVVSCIEGHVLL